MMDYKQELISQIEALKAAQKAALECQEYECVNDIAITISDLIAQLCDM